MAEMDTSTVLEPGDIVTIQRSGEEVATHTVETGDNNTVLQILEPFVSREFDWGNLWDWFALAGWAIAVIAVAAFAFVLLWSFRHSKIYISDLISEDGKASLSRFQALLFTFVFVIAIALMVVQSGRFPSVPLGIWALLAGSLGTYLGAKFLQLSYGAGGGGGGTAAQGVSLVRYGKDADTVAKKLAATSSASTITVPAGKNVFGPSMAVAIAIGTVKLTISGQTTKGGVLNGKLHYQKVGTTAPADQDFAGQIEIETAADAATEVRVQWMAAEETIVTTTVTQIT